MSDEPIMNQNQEPKTIELWNMAICGYSDYEEFCHEVQEVMDEADADE